MTGYSNNTEMLKHYYKRWHESEGTSVEEWMEIMADQVDFRSLAMGRAAGAEFTQPRVSKQDVLGYFQGLLSEWKMVHYTINHYVEQDDRVCAIGTTAWTHKITGKTVDTPKVDFWQFENGKAVSFFEYYDTAALFDCAKPDAAMD